MIVPSKYQDNPAAEPVKAEASPSRSLDRACCRIKEVFRGTNHSEKLNLFLINRGPEMGSTFVASKNATSLKLILQVYLLKCHLLLVIILKVQY